MTVVFIIWMLVQVATGYRCNMQTSNYQVNAQVPWTLQFTKKYASNVATQIKVTFPKDAGFEGASLSCASLAGFSSGSPPCVPATLADGTYYFVVTQMQSNVQNFQVSITGLKNPPSARDIFNIKCEACSDFLCTGPISDTSTFNLEKKLIGKQVDKRYLAIKLGAIKNGVKTGTLKMSYTLDSPLLVKGRLRMLIPKRNQKYFQKGIKQDQLFIQNYNLNLPYQVKVEYGDSTQIARTEIPQIKAPDFTYEPSFSASVPDFLDIYLDNKVEITTPNAIDVTITPVTNPYSTNIITGFGFQTKDEFGNEIDSCEGASVHTDVPGQFQLNTVAGSSKIEIMNGNDKVGATQVKLQVTLIPANDIPVEGKIEITFQKEWKLDCAQTYNVVNVQGDTNFLSTNIVCDVVKNSLSLNQGFVDDKSYVKAGEALIFQIGDFINPDTTEKKTLTVASFQVDGQDWAIDIYNGFSLTFQPGDIKVSLVKPSDPMIYSGLGNYNFNLYAQHQIKSNYIFEISFPPTIKVQNKAQCKAEGNLITGAQCITAPNDGKITLRGLTVPPKINLDFTIDSLTNPGVFTSPGDIYFLIRVDGGGFVDAGKYTLPDGLYGPSFIESFDVRPLNFTAGWQPSTYEFTVRPKARVGKGAYLKIKVPGQITVSDVYSMELGCSSSSNTVSGFSREQIKCIFDKDTNMLQIRDGFAFGDSPGNPPILKFQVPYFRNPRALFRTDMFNVTIYTENDKLFFYFNNTIGPTVVMTGFAAPAGISYVRSSYVNGEPNDYTFSIRSSNYLEDGDTMLITFPPPIQFTSASRCKSNTFYLKSPMVCKISPSLTQVNITLAVGFGRRRQLEAMEKYNPLTEQERNSQLGRRRLAIIPANQVIEFTLTNLSSPASTRPADGSVQYAVTTKDGYPMESLNSGITIRNQQSQTMSERTAGVKPSSFIKDVDANYTITFIPINFEAEMRIIYYVPRTIKINPGVKCRGVKGTAQTDLTCEVDNYLNTVTIINAAYGMESMPDEITVEFDNFRNPVNNIITDTFRVYTQTKDKYDIDKLEQGLNLNFYCIYPCKTCNQSQPDQCYSCYFGTSLEIYLYQDKCLQSCPVGMYEADDITVPTCKFCKSPCKTCGKSAVDCETCIEGYLLYNIDNTCYREVEWYFPFLGASAFFFVFVTVIDCCCKSTNFLHSILFFLCLVEDAVFGYLGYLWTLGLVDGDLEERSLTVVGLISFMLLNFLFIIIHCTSIMKRASGEYLQVVKEFKCSFWSIQILAYLVNFKMSLFQISSFAGRPRFSGTFNQDSWKSFNIFAVLYIVLVYIPFTGDFYIYFTTFGLRQLTSFVAFEAIAVQTLIVLILLLEILEQCSCTGINEADLGKRAGLFNSKKTKKKRRALRSGMGNEESDDYGGYDSEEDYDSELDEAELGESEEEEDSYYDEEDDDDDGKKKKKRIDPTKTQAQLDMLEDLAMQMKKQKDAIDEEQERMKREAERVAEEKAEQEEAWAREREQLRQELDKVKGRQQEIPDEVDEKIKAELRKKVEEEKLRQEEALKAPIVRMPVPVNERVDLSRSIEGDEEYWLQNITPRNESVGEEPDNQTKDGTEINWIENEEAKKSYIGTPRNDEANLEMRAQISEKPVADNASHIPSRLATEENYINKSEAVFGNAGHSQSGMLSNIGGEGGLTKSQIGLTDDKNARKMEATEIDKLEQRSADFGDVSQIDMKGSQENFLNKSDAAFGRRSQIPEKEAEEEQIVANSIEDKEGHSEESSEGIVADHTPFNGIREAIANQEKNRQDKEMESEDELDSEAQDGQQDGQEGRTRRVKQVLYSDKSESSVDDMMEDTPSNYNIANGRLEGKSMGLKAILLFAKNQGIQLGAKAPVNQLPQIQEEANMTGTATNLNRGSALQSSGELGRNWKPMNNPLGGDRRTQIVGQEEYNQINSRTIDDGQGQKNKKPTKRNPGANKNFEEDEQDLKKLQKNNFV